MAVYQITLDGQFEIVEAVNMPTAISVWRNACDIDDTDGPDSVILITPDDVLRAQPQPIGE